MELDLEIYENWKQRNKIENELYKKCQGLGEVLNIKRIVQEVFSLVYNFDLKKGSWT